MLNTIIKKLIKTSPDGIKVKGRVTIREYKAGTKELVQEISQDNLIMVGVNTGKDLLVQWLLSGFTGVDIGLGVNYGAIGTGGTAPATTDTQLTAETNRVIVAYGADITNSQAKLQFFFPDGVLTTGLTYKEFGMVVGGTALANTGNIFNHALFSPTYTKSAGTDTTVEVDITFP